MTYSNVIDGSFVGRECGNELCELRSRLAIEWKVTEDGQLGFWCLWTDAGESLILVDLDKVRGRLEGTGEREFVVFVLMNGGERGGDCILLWRRVRSGHHLDSFGGRRVLRWFEVLMWRKRGCESKIRGCELK